MYVKHCKERGFVTERRDLRVGVLLGTVGASASRLTVTRDARAAEAAGFDTIWTCDHVLRPTEMTTPYPFTDTGEILWNLEDDWFDPLIWLTAVAVSTNTVEIGTNIMLIGLRGPLELAKQIATLDRLSGGRFSLGVGAGWLIEEFEAMAVPPESRGRRLDEWLDVLAEAWTGKLAARSSEHVEVPRAVHMAPVPAHPIPLLIGGTSTAALRRVAHNRAGWIAEARPNDDPVELIRSGVARIHALAELRGVPFRDPLRVVYNANEPLDVLTGRLDGLVAAGVTDVVIEVDFDVEGAADDALARIRG